MDKILGLQRIELQIVTAHMAAVIKGLVGPIDVRRRAAHGDRRILRYIIALPDQTAELIKVTAAHDGRCAAAQTDRFNAAVRELFRVGGKFCRQCQYIAMHKPGVPGFDQVFPDEGRLFGTERYIQFHDHRLFFRHGAPP